MPICDANRTVADDAEVAQSRFAATDMGLSGPYRLSASSTSTATMAAACRNLRHIWDVNGSVGTVWTAVHAGPVDCRTSELQMFALHQMFLHVHEV